MKKNIRGRTLIESDRYTREAETIAPDMRRFDEISEPLYNVLPDYPEMGHPTDSPDVWFLALGDGEVGLSVYYRFDDTSVELLSVTKAAVADDC